MLRRLLLSKGWDDLELVAINDIANPDDVAYLVKYDSVHGRLEEDVRADGGRLHVGNASVALLSEQDPAQLRWGDLGVDVVIDSTGAFTARADAARHLEAGARRVLIGAPSPDADVTLVYGINHHDFDPQQHTVVSNASCTTNSLVPPLKVLMDAFGVEETVVTTVHAYTASQTVVDKPAKKMHRGRAAAVSMIPTSTGADSAAVKVLPALENKLRAIAIRVPVPDGSVTDISARLGRAVSAEEVNEALRAASGGELAGVLGYSTDELVSVDILGRPESGIVHANSTAVAGTLAKVLVWYDNETGYACRCLDTVANLDF
jgi:glyceraldehyde 3-phosphate dehydrogenase/glyceraldehyde-3-phosphate dehydrogenase (NAD(P))